MSSGDIENVYELSPVQQGMLFHGVHAPGSGVYVAQLGFGLDGDIDVAAFERAWQHVVDRHPALRTAFYWEGVEKPLQVVHRKVKLPVERYDWSNLPEDEQERRLENWLDEDRKRDFQFSQPPLMRLSLIRRSADGWQFVWTCHHILLDGWSLPLVLRDLFACHSAYAQSQRPRLEPTRPYSDYIAWLQRQDSAAAEAFWRETLEGFGAPTPFAVDRGVGRPSDVEMAYSEQKIDLPTSLASALQSLARKRQLTMSTLVQGAWALLLSRYSGERDVVFGSVVSGRPASLEGVESIVGAFVNTLPVRARIRPEAPLMTWFRRLQSQLVEMRQYEYSALVDIQGWSGAPRGTPLFESIVGFENYPVDAALQSQAESLKNVDVIFSEKTHYPLAIVAAPKPELSLRIGYDSHRFEDGVITRMLGHFQTILEAIAADFDRPVVDLPVLTEDERYQLLVEWNDTRAEYAANECVHRLFEAQAKRAPDRVAVACCSAAPGSEAEQVTYHELDYRANQLARYLHTLGVGSESLVGVLMERSVDMALAILGILKAGGAYVPLDTASPQARLAYLVMDAQAPVILTQQALDGFLPESDAQVVFLDANWDAIAAESGKSLESGVGAQNLAYAIYTSGSTGKPKGVMIEHRNVLALLHAYEQIAPSGETLSATSVCPFSFDVSVWEFFSTLCFGGTLHILQAPVFADPERLAQYLMDHCITSSYIPPALLPGLASVFEKSDAALPLNRILVGVEPIKQETLQRFRDLSKPLHIVNGYGPTETTVCATFFDFRSAADPERRTPIGNSAPGYQVYVVDRDLHPAPIGVPGEILVGGAGVGRQYLNRPRMTAASFIPNPFAKMPGERLYRTGDQAFRLPDGNIEFLGRTDHQVKIRGFRIELGEIEAVLGQHPDVQDAVALVRGDGASKGKRLVAYITPGSERVPTSDGIQRFLKERLPSYMAPAAVIILDAFPLTSRGKIDRQNLPTLRDVGWKPAKNFAPPRTPVEEVLAGIWAEVLGIERVGIYNDLFELGGHSLLAFQIMSQARDAFDVELPLHQLLESPTVAGLASYIEKERRAESAPSVPPIAPIPRTQDLTLSFAQEMMWRAEHMGFAETFHHSPMLLCLTGPLDAAALAHSLDQIRRRHEILRTVYRSLKRGAAQVVQPPDQPFELPVVDISDLPASRREEELHQLVEREQGRPFDLHSGPVWRVTLFRLDVQDHRLLVVMHHIVTDEWSAVVFVQELAALLDAFSQGHPVPLPALDIQYADFAHWERQFLDGEVLDNLISYWREQLDGELPALELPVDHPRSEAARSANSRWKVWRRSWANAFRALGRVGGLGGWRAMLSALRAGGLPDLQGDLSPAICHTVRLPQSLKMELKSLSRRQRVTLFEVLLVGFQILLHQYSGQESFVVGSPFSNRDRPGTEKLIGLFANGLLLRADLSGDPTFLELLERTHQVVLGAHGHQAIPLAKIVEYLRQARGSIGAPCVRAGYAFHRVAQGPLELSSGLKIEVSPLPVHITTVDVMLRAWEESVGIHCQFEYKACLFDDASIARMADHLRLLLERIVSDPEQRVAHLPLPAR